MDNCRQLRSAKATFIMPTTLPPREAEDFLHPHPDIALLGALRLKTH